MKRVVAGLVVLFLVFYIMTQPDAAANLVQSTWQVAVKVAHGIGDFVTKLAS